MTNHWIFVIGTSTEKAPQNWMAEPPWSIHTSRQYFPNNKRPVSVGQGDRAAIYAAGAGYVGVAEVESTAPKDVAHPINAQRWPYSLQYRLLVGVPADDFAPSPESLGRSLATLNRQSHVQISAEEYRQICGALLSGAAKALV